MGIDPGTQGGVAVLRGEDRSVAFVAGLSPDMTHAQAVDVVEAAKDALRLNGGSLCFCEKVGYMPGDGGKGANTFGRVDGILRGAVLARPRATVIDVPPMTWQAKLGCLTGGHKDISLRRAKELFPACFPAGQFKYEALRIADALLIAEYGRLWLNRG